MGARDRISKLWVLLAATTALAPLAHAGELNLGRVASPEEVAGWNIDVFPDGTNLPAGKGTVVHGKEIYMTSCAGCHGVNLEGGLGPALTGGKGSLTSQKPLKTVGSYWPYAPTLFDYIRRAMPFQAPQSMSNEDVYSVSGYILSVNGLLPSDATVDGGVLTKLQMPNRNAFYVDDRPDAKTPRCMRNCDVEPGARMGR
jgi:mono/diheme cytochrome c family protein